VSYFIYKSPNLPLLARRIKSIRLFLGITQNQMAIKLDIEQSTYCGYQRKAGDLKFKTIVKIAQALGCSIPFLTDINSSEVDEAKWRERFSK
jgi:transcriptional regulator with XRE-family HTH domain